MKFLSNVTKSWKTTLAGLALAVVQVGTALAQSGVGLGKVGSTSYVGLGVALGTALLGAFAKDPGSSAASGSASGPAAKLGCVALIALLLSSSMTGCSGASVANDIVNWTPALQAAVATVDSTAALLAPADASVFAAITASFNADSALLVTQAKAYLANPTASVLAQLQTQTTVMTQDVDAALLQANQIKDSASQQHALLAIQSVGTIANAILALVEGISTKTAVAQMSADSHIKLATVMPLVNLDLASTQLAAHDGWPDNKEIARRRVAGVVARLEQAGF